MCTGLYTTPKSFRNHDFGRACMEMPIPALRAAKKRKTDAMSVFLFLPYSVRVGRIELPSSDWQPDVLPLNHTRAGDMITRHLFIFPVLVPSPGFEPGTADPKSAVISISPRGRVFSVRHCDRIWKCSIVFRLKLQQLKTSYERPAMSRISSVAASET